MVLPIFFVLVVAPLSGVFSLPWNLPPNFRYRPQWDSLRVKWGLNIFSENNFRSLPRRVSDAHDARFDLLRDECQEIGQAEREERRSRAKFAGRRFWKNNDPSVILIYDVNGYVAGMQTAISKKRLEKDDKMMRSIGVWKEDKESMLKSQSHGKNIEGIHYRIRRQIQTSSTSQAQSTTLQGANMLTSGLSSQDTGLNIATQGLGTGTSGPISETASVNTTSVLGSTTPGLNAATPSEGTSTLGLRTSSSGLSTPISGLSSATLGVSTSTPGISTATPDVSTPTPGQSTPTSGHSTSIPGQSTHATGSNAVSSSSTFQTSLTPTPTGTSPHPSGGSSSPFPETPTFSQETPTHSPGTPTIFPGTPTHSPGTPTFFPGTPTHSPGLPTFFPGTPTHSPGTPTFFPGTPTHSFGTSTPYPETPGTPTRTLKPDSSTPFHKTSTHISETQTNIPVTWSPGFSREQMEVLQRRPLLYPYVEDDGVVYFTIYFIEPDRICNPKKARTVDEFEHFGTGAGFYIQNGTGIQSVIKVPRDENKLHEDQKWKTEKCFWTQGRIYSYNFHEDQDCKDQFPLLLNYNEGRLTGFAMLWKMDFSSPYLEHPDKGLLKFMFKKVPRCYNEIGRLTKLQIYFTNNYLSHRC